MNTRIILLLNFVGISHLLWVLNLVRRGRLYVGYGVMFIVAVIATLLTLSIPKLLVLVSDLCGIHSRSLALVLLAFGFVAFVLVYILSQITIISNRVATVAQELAILRAKEYKNQLSLEGYKQPKEEPTHDLSSTSLAENE